MSYKIVKLREVCSFLNGGTPSRDVARYFEGEIPWITSADLADDQDVVTNARFFITEEAIESSATKIVPKDNILLVSRTGVGKVAITGVDICISQDFTGIIPNKLKVDLHYLFRFLQSSKSHFTYNQRGATIKGITRQVIADLEIPLPPLGEQQRIAAILDKADALRAKRRAALAKLDTLLQSTFLHMFGDPVTNPMGWEVSNVGGMGLYISDGNYAEKYPRAHEFVEEGIPFIRANNLSNGTVVWDDMRFITPEKHEYLQKGHVKTDDVLICTRGNIGQAALVPPSLNDANLNAQLVLLRVVNTNMTSEYLVWAFNMPRMQIELLKFQTGTALKQLPIGNLKRVEIPIPPIDVQKKFSSIAKQLNCSRVKHQESADKIDNLFHSLQQRAFKGEL